MSRNQINSQKPMIRSAVAAVESLENRCMLSASPVFITRHGTLDVNGTRHNDQIVVSLNHRHHNVLNVSFDGQMFAFKASAVRHMAISGGAGNDTITVSSDVTTPATLLGGMGDDTITAGGGDDNIDGGTGNDHCHFNPHSGTAFADVPQAVQTGLTTLAQGATITTVQVFHDDGQTYYGAVVTIANVETRIVVDSDGNPVSNGSNDDSGEHHHSMDHQFGIVISVDSNAGTLTAYALSEHGRAAMETLNLDPNVTVTLDGSPATVADLLPGTWFAMQFSATDPTTVVSIQALARRIEGSVTAVDSGSITVQGEHGVAQTFSIDPNAVVMLDGSTSTLDAITVGMQVRLKLSSDNTTVTQINAESTD